LHQITAEQLLQPDVNHSVSVCIIMYSIRPGMLRQTMGSQIGGKLLKLGNGVLWFGQFAVFFH